MNSQEGFRKAGGFLQAAARAATLILITIWATLWAGTADQALAFSGVLISLTAAALTFAYDRRRTTGRRGAERHGGMHARATRRGSRKRHRCPGLPCRRVTLRARPIAGTRDVSPYWAARTLRNSSASCSTDAGSVLLLWADSDAEPTRTDDLESLQRLITHDPAALIVAEDDGRLVGSVIVGSDGWRGSVYRLAVAPPHRRRGLGRRLLAEGRIAACCGWRSPQSGHRRRDRTRSGWLLARNQLGAATPPAGLRKELTPPILMNVDSQR